MNGMNFILRPVKTGVPQESVLEIFSVVCIEIISPFVASWFQFIYFADDTNIYE